MIDIINCKGIESFLEPNIKKEILIEYLSRADSTNTIVKKRALTGEKEGLLLVAGEQTCGRGRMGRRFFSPGDTGVYLSLLLKPDICPQDAVQITTAAAVSVCEALEEIGVEKADIKWVNDVFINGKKICGILTEAGFNSRKNTLDYVVLGVGVNMYTPENGFPDDLSEIAGAVFTEKKDNLRNKFIAGFINSFMYYYKNIENKHHCDKYAERCFVVGKEINVISGEDARPAKALAVDENCGLVVQFENGDTTILNSGEISVRVV